MYDKEFASIYDKYGWDVFSKVLGHAILEFFKNKNVKIKNHLDLGCGVGELCHLFYNQNLNTKGIDISFNMIELARQKYPNIPFEIKDIIEYETKEKYTLVTCTCDVINHILKEEDLEKLFQNVYSYLEENAYFIFDVINEEEIILNKSFRSERENDAYVDYFLTREEDNKIKNNLKVYQKNNLILEENIIEKIYPKEYITHLAEKTGFQVVKCASHIMNEHYNSNNKLFFILKK